VEVNCDVVKEGVNGFAITEEEWIGNLELLRQSPPISAWSCRAPNSREVVLLARDRTEYLRNLVVCAALRRPSRRALSHASFKHDLARSAGSNGAATSR